MSRKYIGFLATIIFTLIPFLALSEQIDTQISADSITVEKGEILYAEGNVTVKYGNNKIVAKALQFNKKSGELKFTDLQDFNDGVSIQLSAEEAVISSDLTDGIFLLLIFT